MAEYEACIHGIEAAIDLRIKYLKVYGDSNLVISQINGDWETRHQNLIPYREHVMRLIPYFDEITLEHISREENNLADALATLASMFKVKWPMRRLTLPSTDWTSRRFALRLMLNWMVIHGIMISKSSSKLKSILPKHR